MARSEFEVKEQWIGTGDMTAYTFNFKIEDLLHLLIYVQDASGALVAGYPVRGDDVVLLSSVTFDAIRGGGTINLASVLPSDYVLTALLANDAPTQPSEYQTKTSFTLPSFEAALDFLGGALQRVAYLAQRAMKLHPLDDEDTIDLTLPIGFTANPGSIIAINPLGTGLEYLPDTTAALEAEIAVATATANTASASAATANSTANAASTSAATANSTANTALTQSAAALAAASGITVLTGDVTATGPGSSVATITGLARSKLAAGTASHVVINDGAGVLSSEATLAKVRGGTGADNSSVTFPSSGTIPTVPSSGPVRSSGSALTTGQTDLTTEVTGALPIANGGTNAATANAGLNNLLPSQGGNSTKVLTTDGTNTSWGSGASGISALTGDVTASGSGSVAATIAANAVTNAKMATMAANTVKANVTGGSAVPTDVALVSAPTASAAMIRDSSGNVAVNAILNAFTTTATAASSTTLTVASTRSQQFTGSTTQTLVLPDATTLRLGQQFYVMNRSTGVVTVNANGGSLVQSLATNVATLLTCTSIGSSTGTWDVALIANTVLSNPMTTTGDVIYASGGSTPTRLPGNITAVRQFLAQTGNGSVSAAPGWVTPTIPTVQKLTSTGSTTGQLFSVTSANATAGATYTNNGQTFTVLNTIAGATQLFTSQTGAPTGSGTLTKATGSGDATIAFASTSNLATYTAPAGCLYIRVLMVGGGGGGSGSGTTGAGNGGNGGNTIFSGTGLIANGGTGGTYSGAGGNGGTASLGTGPIGVTVPGSDGSGINSVEAGGVFGVSGGKGGDSPYFAGSGRSAYQAAGGAAVVNTGGGGTGGGVGAVASAITGSGGGSGGFAEAIIASPTTLPYQIAAAGTVGTAGTSGFAGGLGGTGFVYITEYYQ